MILEDRGHIDKKLYNLQDQTNESILILLCIKVAYDNLDEFCCFLRSWVKGQGRNGQIIVMNLPCEHSREQTLGCILIKPSTFVASYEWMKSIYTPPPPH